MQTNYIYRLQNIKDKEPTDWYRCQCGVIFQEDFPSHKAYDKKYMETYSESFTRAIMQRYHQAYLYCRLIEELSLGRKMLDVGFSGNTTNMDYFAARGWLTWGIDRNVDIEPGGRIYQGDFVDYDFALPVDEKTLKEVIGELSLNDRKFDLIWMSHVFEHFNDPIKALYKAYDLLEDDGILYISTPDIDFINKTGVPNFAHFTKDEHYLMWSESALKRELERIGFKVVLSRRNFSSRCISWYDIQVIAQKNYF